MNVKLGDILCYQRRWFYLVCKHPKSARVDKLCAVGLTQEDADDPWFLQPDDGEWDFDKALASGHTRIIGNIFDKE